MAAAQAAGLGEIARWWNVDALALTGSMMAGDVAVRQGGLQRLEVAERHPAGEWQRTEALAEDVAAIDRQAPVVSPEGFRGIEDAAAPGRPAANFSAPSPRHRWNRNRPVEIAPAAALQLLRQKAAQGRRLHLHQAGAVGHHGVDQRLADRRGLRSALNTP
jgi:hypothetical protein